MKSHASMNRSYRLTWSEATQSYHAVAETAKGAKKGGGMRTVRRHFGVVMSGIVSSVALSSGLGSMSYAQQAPPVSSIAASLANLSNVTKASLVPQALQLPSLANVAQGQVQITQSQSASSASMNVNQSSDKAVINWNSFNLGANASVNFNQPSSNSAVLNRVLDTAPSQIFGSITSNGQVFLSNPNGIYFSPTAQVDVGGLVATTHSIADGDFMNGLDQFDRNGSVSGVVNEGRLSAKLSGYIALLAPEVQNKGVVLAQAGTVVMAAGEQVTLNFSQNHTLAGITTTPAAIATLIDNQLAVQAPDGQIILSAVALNRLQAGVINNSGAIEASSMVSKGGKIVLEGDEIHLSSTSQIKATGPSGGGTVLIGGESQGTGTLRHASQVVMDQGAVIDASATAQGDGGQVILYTDTDNANGTTVVQGTVLALGGKEGGNGGLIETSGHQVNTEHAFVNASAPKGSSGTWLVDPADATITQTIADGYATSLSAGTNVTDLVSGNITTNSGVTISKTGATAATLTLEATGSITLGSSTSITSSSGALNLVLWSNSNNGGGQVNIGNNSTFTTKGGVFVVGGGSTSASFGPSSISGPKGAGTGQASAGLGDGVVIGGAVAVTTAGGLISITGSGSSSTVPSSVTGITINAGTSLNAGSGTLTLIGSNFSPSTMNTGIRNGILLAGSSGSKITLTSSNSTSSAMTINGVDGLATSGSNVEGLSATYTDFSAISGTLTLKANQQSFTSTSYNAGTLALAANSSSAAFGLKLSGESWTFSGAALSALLAGPTVSLNTDATSNLTLSSSGDQGSATSGTGVITVGSAITKSSGAARTTLGLNAYKDINLNASVNASSGALSLMLSPQNGSGAASGDVTIASNVSITTGGGNFYVGKDSSAADLITTQGQNFTMNSASTINVGMGSFGINVNGNITFPTLLSNSTAAITQLASTGYNYYNSGSAYLAPGQPYLTLTSASNTGGIYTPNTTASAPEIVSSNNLILTAASIGSASNPIKVSGPADPFGAVSNSVNSTLTFANSGKTLAIKNTVGSSFVNEVGVQMFNLVNVSIGNQASSQQLIELMGDPGGNGDGLSGTGHINLSTDSNGVLNLAPTTYVTTTVTTAVNGVQTSSTSSTAIGVYSNTTNTQTSSSGGNTTTITTTTSSVNVAGVNVGGVSNTSSSYVNPSIFPTNVSISATHASVSNYAVNMGTMDYYYSAGVGSAYRSASYWYPYLTSFTLTAASEIVSGTSALAPAIQGYNITLNAPNIGSSTNPLYLSGVGGVSGTLNLPNGNGSTYIGITDDSMLNVTMYASSTSTPWQTSILWSGGDHLNYTSNATQAVLVGSISARANLATYAATPPTGIDLSSGRSLSITASSGQVALAPNSINTGIGTLSLSASGVGAPVLVSGTTYLDNGNGLSIYGTAGVIASGSPEITAANVYLINNNTTTTTAAKNQAGIAYLNIAGTTIGVPNRYLNVTTSLGDIYLNEVTPAYFNNIAVNLQGANPSQSQAVSIHLATTNTPVQDVINFSDVSGKITLTSTNLNVTNNSRTWSLQAPARTVELDSMVAGSGAVSLGGNLLYLGGNVATTGAAISLSSQTGIILLNDTTVSSQGGPITVYGPGTVSSYSSVPGAHAYSFSLDSTSNTSAGFIDYGASSNNYGGGYLSNLTLKANNGTNSNSIYLYGTHNITGNFVSNGTAYIADYPVTINTNANATQNAGSVSFIGPNLTSVSSLDALTINTSNTSGTLSGGAVNLYSTTLHGTLNLSTLSVTSSGSASGTSGTVTLPAISLTAATGAGLTVTGGEIDLKGNVSTLNSAIALTGNVQIASNLTLSTWNSNPTSAGPNTSGSVTIAGTGISSTQANVSLTINTKANPAGQFGSGGSAVNWNQSAGSVSLVAGNAGGNYLSTITVDASASGGNNNGISGSITLAGVKSVSDQTYTGAAITVSTASAASAGNVSLTATGNLALNAGLTASGNVTINLASGMSALESATGSIAASGLSLNGSGAVYTLQASSTNAVSTLAVASGVSNVSFVNSNALTIGAVGAVSGITSSGTVSISTLSNDLTIANNITTTNATTSALVLSAGASTAAGTSTGGNVVVSNSASVILSSGGLAKIYTGSVLNSTGLTALVGSGSGGFRYDSSPTVTNYTTALLAKSGTASGLYAIYREQPVLSLPTSTLSAYYTGLAYAGTAIQTGLTGYVNGDASDTANGYASTNAITPGQYTFTATNVISGLGYAVQGTSVTLTINPQPLSVTATSLSSTYTANNYSGTYSVSYSGFVAGQTASNLGGTLTYAVSNTNNPGVSVTPKNAGTYSILPQGLTSSNYAITFVPGTLTINKAPLTVTANPVSMVYTGTAYSGGAGYTLGSFLGSDTSAVVSGSIAYGGTSQGAIFVNPVATPYTITLSGLSADNYAPNYVASTLNITKATLTYTTTVATGTYGALASVGAINLYGFVGNDATNNNVTASVGVYNSGGTLVTLAANTPAGTYTQKVTSLSGNVGSSPQISTSLNSVNNNYIMATTGNTVAQLTIAPRPISLSATKTFDGTNSLYGSSFTVTNTVAGDTVTVTEPTTSPNAFSTTTVSGSSQPITSFSGLTVNNSNYTFTGASGNVTINPAPLTVSVSKTYDAGNSFTTGFVLSGNTFGLATPTVSSGSATVSSANAGSYSAFSSNTLVLSNNNFTTGSVAATINKAPLGVVLAGTYSGATSGTNTITATSYKLTGLVNGQTAGTVTATLNSPNVADNATNYVKTLTFTGTANVNNYVITPLRNATADTTTTNLVTVNPAPLGIVASGVYSGTNTINLSSSTLYGLMTGESFSIASVVASDKNVLTPSKYITGINLNPSGSTASLSNYYLNSSFVSSTNNLANALTITTANVTLTGSMVYTGSTSVAGSNLTATGVGGQTFTVTGAGDASNLSAANANVHTASALSSSTGLSLGLSSNGGIASNYSSSLSVTGSLVAVTPAPLGISVVGTYSASNTLIPSTPPTLTGKISTDALSIASVMVSNPNVSGNGSNYVTAITLSGGGHPTNYYLSTSYNGVAGMTSTNTVTINPLPLTVTATGVGKVYDGSVNATVTLTSSNVPVGQTVTFSDASATFNTKNVGANTITVSGIAIASASSEASNYALSNTTATSSAAISQATLTVNAVANAKSYDGTTSALSTPTISGLVGGDSATASEVYNSKDVSLATTLTPSVSINDGNSGLNYSVVLHSVAGTISKAPLSITAVNSAKFVTQSDPSLYAGVTYSGLVNGELPGSVLGGTLAISRSNSAVQSAGTYNGVLTPSGLTSSNYAITYYSGNFTIVPAGELLVQTNNIINNYGVAFSAAPATVQYLVSGTTIATLTRSSTSGNTYTYSDNASGSITFTLAPVPTNGAASYKSTSNNYVVGTYNITGTNISIVGQNFTNSPVFTGTLSVNPAALTPSATPTKVYDGSATLGVVSASLSGKVSTDVVSASGQLNFNGANAGSNLSYTVNNVALSGADQANYYLSSGTTFSCTNGVITAKAVSLTPMTATKVYDSTTAYTPSAADLSALSSQLGVANNSVSAATETFDSASAASAKTLTLGAVTIQDGNNGHNYQVSLGSNSTSSITKATLTVTGTTVSNKVYDGVSTATLSSGSLVGVKGTDATGMVFTQSGDFTSVNANVNIPVTASDTLTGGASGNYVLVQPSGLSANITPKALTVTGTVVSGKTYDGTLAATVSSTGSIATGLVGTQTLGLSAQAVFASANAGNQNAVVSYALANGSNGGLASNYSIANSVLSATIDKAPLTVKANDAAKFFSQQDPSGYGGVSYIGLVNGESSAVVTPGNVSLSVTCNGNPGCTNLSAGNYDLIPSGFSASNYTITPVNGVYTVVPAGQLLIQVPNATLSYGSNINLLPSSVSYEVSSAGNVYTLTTLNLVSANNNQFTFADSGNTSVSFNLSPIPTPLPTPYNSAQYLSGSGNWIVGNYKASSSPLVISGSNLTNTTAAVVGNLSITPLGVGISLAPQKVYDGGTSMTSPAITAVGKLTGDTLTVSAQGQYNSANVGLQNVGYNLSQLSLGGADSNNYYLVTGNTYSGVNGTITAKPVTLTAPSETKVYDGLTNLVPSIADLSTLSSALGVSGNVVTGVTLSYDNANAGSNKTLTPSAAVIADGNGGNNFRVTYAVNSSSSITKAPLVVNATAASKVYDGSASSTAIPTYSGLIAGDAIVVGEAFNSKDVVTASTLTPVATVNAGAGNSNYSFTFNSASGTITPKPVTVNVPTPSKVYDGTTTLSADQYSLNLSGLISGESVGASGQAAFTSVNAGTAVPYSISNLTLVNDIGNYTLSGVNSINAANGVISPKAVTLNPQSVSKVYDANSSIAATASDLSYLSNELGVSGNSVSAATLTFANANAGTGNKVLNLSQATVSDGNNGQNFTITLGSNSTSTISKATLTVSGTTVTSKPYDGSSTATLASGVLVGLQGTDAITLTPAGNFADVNANVNIPVAASDSISGSAAGNYTLVQPTGLVGTITPKTLSVTGTVVPSKVYDGTVAAAITNPGSLQGLVGSETLGLTGVANFASAGVGVGKNVSVTYSWTSAGSGATAGLASNYTVSSGTLTSSVMAAPLTITPNNATKFVTQANPSGFAGVSYNGLVNGETASVVTQGTVASSGVCTVPVSCTDLSAGTYNLTASGFSSPNYNISYGTGSFTVIPAGQLLIALPNASVVYGSAINYMPNVVQYETTVGNIINSLTLSSSTGNTFTYSDGAGGTSTFTLSAAPSPLRTNFTSSSGNLSVGNYNYASSTLNITGVNLTSNVPVVTGTLAISAKALSLGSSPTKVYDGSLSMPNAQLALSGVLPSDLVGVSGTGQYASVNASNTANYSVSNLALSGADANNYYITSGSTLTGNNGVITPKPVTLTAPVQTKVYDGSTNLTPSVSDLSALSSQLGVAGNIVSGVTLTYDNKNVATGKTLTPSSAVISDGNNGQNFTISYSPNALSAITKAPLVVSAVTQTKVYDGSTSALSTPSVSGLQAGDTAVVSQSYVSPNVLGVNASSLVPSVVTLNDGNSGNNYSLSLNNALGSITPKSLGISQSSPTKVYDATATITNTPVDLSGVVGADVVTGAAAGQFTSTNVGTGLAYALNSLVLAGASAANYMPQTSINYSNNNGTITPASITLNATKVYDGTTSLATQNLTATGVASQTLTLTAGSAQTNSANVNAANTLSGITGLAIADGTGLASNYTVSSPSVGVVAITPAPLSISATDTVKNYDGTTSVTGATTQPTPKVVSGTLFTNASNGGVKDSISGGLVAFTDPAPGDKNKVTTISGVTVSDGNSGANYSVTYVRNTTSTIVSPPAPPPAPPTLTNAQLASYTGTQIAALTPTQIVYLTPPQIAALTTAQVNGLTPYQFNFFNAAQIQAFTPPQIAAFLPAQVNALNTSQLMSMSVAQITAFTSASVGLFTTAQLSGFGVAQLQAFTPNQISGLTPAQVSSLNVSQLQGFSGAQFAALQPQSVGVLSVQQMAGLSNAQVQSFTPGQLSALSSVQFGALSNAQVFSLSADQVGGLSPRVVSGLSSALLAGFSPTQIQGFSGLQMAALTPLQANALSATQWAAVSGSQFSALSPSTIAGLSLAQMGQLNANQLQALSAAQATSLSGQQLASLNSQQVSSISKAALSALSSAQVSGLSNAFLQALSTGQVSGLAPAQVSVLSLSQLNALTPLQMGSLLPSQVGALSPNQFASLQAQQLSALSPVGLSGLSPEQFSALNGSQIQVFSPSQFAAFTPKVIGSLSVGQVASLNNAQVQALSGSQVGALSAAQIAALGTGPLSVLSPSQVGALNPTQLTGLTKTQINSLSLDQVTGLSANQLQAMSLVQLGFLSESQIAVLTPTQLSALSSAQLAVLSVQPPIVPSQPSNSGNADKPNNNTPVNPSGEVPVSAGLVSQMLNNAVTQQAPAGSQSVVNPVSQSPPVIGEAEPVVNASVAAPLQTAVQLAPAQVLSSEPVNIQAQSPPVPTPESPQSPPVPESSISMVVNVLRAPSSNNTGLIAVVLPKGALSASGTVSIPVPQEAIVPGSEVSVSLPSNENLPVWIAYNPNSQAFDVQGAPEGGLPLTVVFDSGGQRTLILISEHSGP